MLRTLKRRGIPLPSEIGAFITLEACEQLLDRPAELSTHDVAISEIGEVLCADGLAASAEAGAVKALLNLLGDLLVCSAPGVPSMLLDLVERGPSRRDLTLAGLLSELEACLVPLNRGATRRVLARLVRETRKAGPSQRASAAPAAADLDAQLDALIEAPVPSRKFSRRPPRPDKPVQPAAAPRKPPPAAFAADDEAPTRPMAPKEGALLVAAASAFASPPAKPAPQTAAEGGSEPDTQPRAPWPDPQPAAASSEHSQRDQAAGAALRAAAAAAHEDDEHEPTSRRDAAGARKGEKDTRARAEAAASGRGRGGSSAEQEGARGARASRSASGDDEAAFDARRSRGRGGAPDDEERASTSARGSRGSSSDEEFAANASDAARARDGSSADEQRDSARSRAARGRAGAEAAPASFSRRRTPQPAGPLIDLDEEETRSARGRLGLWVFGLSTAAALGLLLIYFTLGRDNARQALGLLPQTPPPAAAKPPAPVKTPVGDLLVTSQPGRAQVLLAIGPGPALATDIPQGVAQEFVAVADGYAPARAVLPADTEWEEQGGQARAELAIQATRATSEAAKNNFGATLLPRDVGTPKARLGTVRVITTPRGAHVYQLIGFTPDVRVENLPLDRGYELIVYLEGRAPVRRTLEASDFQERAGKRVAELTIALDARPKDGR